MNIDELRSATKAAYWRANVKARVMRRTEEAAKKAFDESVCAESEYESLFTQLQTLDA